MAVPVIETSAQNDSGGVTAITLTINVPAGTVDDNLLLTVVGSDDNTAASPDEWLDETGWTKPIMIGDSTVDAKLAMYWRVASSEPVSYTFDHGSSDELWGIMFRISGVNTTNPINIVGVATLDGGGTNRDALSITTTVDDCLAFYAVAFDGGDGTPFGEPTGWTEHSEHNSGTGGTDACGVVGTKTQATAGATGTASISSTVSDGSVAIQFAVEPAATGNFTPGSGTLTLSGFAPRLLFDHPVGSGTLSLTGFAPVRQVSVTKIPGAATLSLAGFAPTIDITSNLVSQPGAASLVITGQPVTIHTINAVGAGQLTLTGFAPVATIANSNPVFTPGGAVLALTGFPPTRIVKGWKSIDESEDIWTEIPPDGGDVWTPVTESTDTWT